MQYYKVMTVLYAQSYYKIYHELLAFNLIETLL
jgi:hypothetical protein